MTLLLPFIKEQRALGFTEKSLIVADALEEAFRALVKGLTPHDQLPSQVVFSVDSFDESLDELQVHQDDDFIALIDRYRGEPKVKICHMRHYSTPEAAHWHALFAETDNEGNFIRIIATDSRIDSEKQGITAQKDITKYTLLNSLNINFIAGEQQPFGIKICWLYALANLASLVATGKVYEQKTSNLGIELSGLIEKKKEMPSFFQPLAKPNYPLPWQKIEGGGLILLAVILPLSLPATLFTLAVGIAIALLGAVLLLGDLKEEATSHLRLVSSCF